ncbi:MAG: hypothetical protein JXA15_05385 [Spirochaetales bacterium]|nr:hypothetical protein [Spirochaetales bacterium]
MKDAWDFARLDEFLVAWEPLTPWGKDIKAAREVLVERAEIEARHDDIDAALALLAALETDPVSLDRLSWHLRRMPRVPVDARDSYDMLELFQIKKFLANHRGVASIANAGGGAGRFGLTPACVALAAELDRGGSDAETFFLADAFHPGLAAVRSALSRVDAELRAVRAAAESRARHSAGLDFDGRDFLVVPAAALSAPIAAQAGLSLEPYDDAQLLVRMLPGAAELRLAAERESLLAREAVLEGEALARLSVLAREAMPELRAAVAAVARFDLARAGAALALKLGLTRPRLDSDAMTIEGARFVPVESDCGRLGLSYRPLDARFDAAAVVLFGSNMGGKTVALQTVLFLQLLAQAGLFVPARVFRTKVYARIAYVGELAGERLAGLSGFGFEIIRFERTWKDREGSLVAFDEFARTTGSHEAEALLSAIVGAYAEGAGGRAFFATHFRGIARVEGAAYLRMKGLDRNAASDALDSGAPLEERLAGINRHMRYELVDDDAAPEAGSDALAIAELLGLDPGIAARAGERFRSGQPGVLGDQD